MDSPTLLVTPNSNSPFPHHQRLTHTRNYSSKDSAENAIFAIYSMYGDEYSRASTSWADIAGNRSSLRTRLEKQRPDGYEEPDFTHYPTVYSDTEVCAAPPLSMPVQFKGKNSSSRGSVATSSSARPTSSYATPSSLQAHSDLFEDNRLANSSNLRTSDLSASSYTPAPLRSGSPHSKRSSRSSPLSTKELPLLPSSVYTLPPLPPMHATPSPTPPRQPSPPLLPVKPHGKHILPPVSSPSSKISLVPSEGEDIDAFHVRNTYAQLEASGVKGDGYEEGIERTRARIGKSRTSQLQADAALGDGTEKNQDLDEKEIQVLRSVDRCVFSINPSHTLISKKTISVTDSSLFLLMIG